MDEMDMRYQEGDFLHFSVRRLDFFDGFHVCLITCLWLWDDMLCYSPFMLRQGNRHPCDTRH